MEFNVKLLFILMLRARLMLSISLVGEVALSSVLYVGVPVKYTGRECVESGLSTVVGVLDAAAAPDGETGDGVVVSALICGIRTGEGTVGFCS